VVLHGTAEEVVARLIEPEAGAPARVHRRPQELAPAVARQEGGVVHLVLVAHVDLELAAAWHDDHGRLPEELVLRGAHGDAHDTVAPHARVAGAPHAQQRPMSASLGVSVAGAR
jgi:hypothetical protein